MASANYLFTKSKIDRQFATDAVVVKYSRKQLPQINFQHAIPETRFTHAATRLIYVRGSYD